jgi:hypothetical protein
MLVHAKTEFGQLFYIQPWSHDIFFFCLGPFGNAYGLATLGARSAQTLSQERRVATARRREERSLPQLTERASDSLAEWVDLFVKHLLSQSKVDLLGN